MPHHVYHVKGVVIRGVSRGEADRSLLLLTDKLGLITVYVRGVRREESRLRYILQPLSFIEASIVRGKDLWRLTTANPIHTPSGILTLPGRKILSRLLHILPHVLEPGAKIPMLWKEVELLHNAFIAYPGRMTDFEVIGLARALSCLGYWSGDAKGMQAHIETPYEYLQVIPSEMRKKYIDEINTILRST